METLNKEFWEKRDAAMKRFMASKERKVTIYFSILPAKK